MSNESFNFGGFIKESVDTIAKPKEYFASLATEGGLGKPVIKALIYGILTGVFKLIWSLLNLSAVTGGLFGGAVGVMAFIWSIIGALIGLFIGAVIILIISAICGGDTKFEANVHVSASLMVLMPVSALFSVFAGFSFFLNWVVGLLINLYGLYLLYNGLVGTLKAKESTSKVIAWVLAAILILFLVIGFAGRKAAKGFMNKYGTDTENFFDDLSKDMEKAAKDITDDLEQATDEMGKALEEATDTLK